jgi:hypothetical protein
MRGGDGANEGRTPLALAQRQKISSDRNDQSQSEVRRMIAKRRTARESPERSSPLLVVVVCTEAFGMPIQLWKDPVRGIGQLVKSSALDPAHPTA